MRPFGLLSLCDLHPVSVFVYVYVSGSFSERVFGRASVLLVVRLYNALEV